MPPKYAIEPQFHFLSFGEVLPTGWLRNQMIADLDSGFAGWMQSLAPRTTLSGIFGNNRNKPGALHDAADQKGPLFVWWNGESEGNWRSGNIMMSLLTGVPSHKANADAQVAEALNTQDSDGYLGIYSRELRWPDGSSENGELWTQACLLHGLLAYYEATDRTEVLTAIEKAVQLTARNYGENIKSAFGGGDLGGVSHGLMFTDVLNRLYELTGKTVYRDFGVYLYQNYSTSCSKLYNDLSLPVVLDPGLPFDDHGVHDYEHLRAVLWNAYITGDPLLISAANSSYAKAKACITPAGGPIGDEWISGQKGHPDKGYEGCSQSEWMTSCIHAAQLTGESTYCDLAENTFFNAAQGSRLPNGKGLIYISSDNRPEISGKERNKYSPCHEDVANCCAPNFTKISPLFVSSMWMRAVDGLAATLYGPCELRTRVKGIPVLISEVTNYPFTQSISLHIQPEKNLAFILRLRVPTWATRADVSCPDAEIVRMENWILLKKQWKKGDVIFLSFETSARPVPALNREFYLQYGPLFYALPILSVMTSIKDYPVAGFHDFAVAPVDSIKPNFAIIGFADRKIKMSFEIVKNPAADPENPWVNSPVKLKTRLMNRQTRQPETIELVPMGCGEAALRRVTFPMEEK